MVRYISTHAQSYEFEISVDETDEITSPEEHFFIVNELHRLGIKIIGLAPRFPGKFEKGVDYIGDRVELESALNKHAAVLDTFSDYKISLHSGSDKFSIYPLMVKYFGKNIHLKTSGTSYLEAMRIVATVQPELFCLMLKEAITHFPIESKTYHVSANIEKIPDVRLCNPDSLEKLLDDFHVREVLHVGFGAVLNKYHKNIIELLNENESLYYERIATHFNRHFDLIEGNCCN
jgi:tagaturonate epimerase